MTIKPVADLYLITYEDGSPYKYTHETGEAIEAIGAGFKVEEFVSLENHRAAMLQGADGALIREGTRQTDELVMWIKRLAHSLRKANPDSKLQSDAMGYLNRKGLIRVEDVLR